MPTTIINAAVLGIAAVIAGLFGWGGINNLSRTDSARMELESLRYENGKFYQVHKITGATSMRAEWAAKITRDGGFLCVGGGTSIYKNGGSPPMDPSFWTGDDCPELRPGDKADAVWEYVDENNVRRRIGANIDIE